MARDKNYDCPTITVRQVRSAIANKPKNRGTLRALGLRKIGDTNVLPDRPEIRGMIARIPHLIEVQENSSIEEGSA
jgi:large subunit ribosomal protein L30